MSTKVINIYGAPGAGKSTLAAEVYVDLKKRGYSVELVTEVAKDYVYLGKKPDRTDQITIAAKQQARLFSRYDKVDYIVTDCPIYLPYFYLDNFHQVPLFDQVVNLNLLINTHYVVQNFNFLLPSSFNYEQDGRFETQEEAKIITQSLHFYLDDIREDYRWITREDGLFQIIKEIGVE